MPPPLSYTHINLVLDYEDGLGCNEDCKRWLLRETVKITKTEYNRLSGDTKKIGYVTATTGDPPPHQHWAPTIM